MELSSPAKRLWSWWCFRHFSYSTLRWNRNTQLGTSLVAVWLVASDWLLTALGGVSVRESLQGTPRLLPVSHFLLPLSGSSLLPPAMIGSTYYTPVHSAQLGSILIIHRNNRSQCQMSTLDFDQWTRYSDSDTLPVSSSMREQFFMKSDQRILFYYRLGDRFGGRIIIRFWWHPSPSHT